MLVRMKGLNVRKNVFIIIDFIVEQIKKNITILEIAEEYGLKLKQSGRSYFTLCPFHGEKTASCSLVPNKDSTKDYFHCFGCGAGGDQINLFAKLNNMSYGQAKSMLAKRFGLSKSTPLPQAVAREYAKSKRDRTIEKNFLQAYKQIYYELCSIRDMMNNLGCQYDMEQLCIVDCMELLVEDDLLVAYYQESDSHEELLRLLLAGLFEVISFERQIETFMTAKEVLTKWKKLLQKRLISII